MSRLGKKLIKAAKEAKQFEPKTPQELIEEARKARVDPPTNT